MVDFTPALKSGLKKKGELDRIFGVTRIMVINYLTGKSRPREHNLARINIALAILDKLVNEGKLPFQNDATNDYRKRAVDKIVDYINTRLQ